MEIKQVKLVYFSPTGTSRTVLESIAQGIAVEDVEHIDLTLPEGARQTISPFSDELVIVGAPVYGGRLPVDASSLYAKNLLNFITPQIDQEAKSLKLDWEDETVTGTALTRDGAIIHPALTGETA